MSYLFDDDDVMSFEDTSDCIGCEDGDQADIPNEEEIPSDTPVEGEEDDIEAPIEDGEDETAPVEGEEDEVAPEDDMDDDEDEEGDDDMGEEVPVDDSAEEDDDVAATNVAGVNDPLAGTTGLDINQTGAQKPSEFTPKMPSGEEIQ